MLWVTPASAAKAEKFTSWPVRPAQSRRNVWKAGQSFTEVEPHLVVNRSATTPAVLRITQIVPVGATLREDVDPPRCRRS